MWCGKQLKRLGRSKIVWVVILTKITIVVIFSTTALLTSKPTPLYETEVDKRSCGDWQDNGKLNMKLSLKHAQAKLKQLENLLKAREPNLTEAIDLISKILATNSSRELIDDPVHNVHSVKSKTKPADEFKGDIGSKTVTKLLREPQVKDVCGESYQHQDLSAGYPFFYKGFDEQNCTDVPVLSDILTIALAFPGKEKSRLDKIPLLLQNIQNLYPGVPVIVGVNEKFSTGWKPDYIHQIIKVLPNSHEMAIWKKIISSISTKYVYIARHVNHISWHSRLTRLIREINDLKTEVAASSARDNKGHWAIDCEQSSLRNFTLAYRLGYRRSSHECVYCDYTSSPFIARSALLKKITLPNMASAEAGFRSWFLNMKSAGLTTVICPDSMSFIDESDTHKKESYVDLAQEHQVELLKLSNGVEFTFSCSEANTGCRRTSGLALSHCCLNKLGSMVKFFMKTCQQAGLMCELQEGTLLGAVKFNGILPWERDADVTFHTANFTALKSLAPKFREEGYTLHVDKEPWCCVDDRKAGGIFMLNSNDWHIEIYGQHIMDSEKLILEGLQPTLVDLDGLRVGAPASPGLFARNRYGHEIFQHAQHWGESSKQASGWHFYKPGAFNTCPTPGHHSCLDQYIADGNIPFMAPDL